MKVVALLTDCEEDWTRLNFNVERREGVAEVAGLFEEADRVSVAGNDLTDLEDEACDVLEEELEE